MKSARQKMLDMIGRNIEKAGFHIYVVAAGSYPRFAYTIGLSESLGAELVIPGAITYDVDDVYEIIHSIRKKWKGAKQSSATFSVRKHGSFSLREADATWTNKLLLGALDYYQRKNVVAYQIVPDEAHWTIDVPDMRRAFDPAKEPVWRWLTKPWKYDVPEEAATATNLAALRGAPITEATRWEDDYWEMFAGSGPDTPEKEMRLVPLSTLLAADPSLAPVVKLAINEGIHRTSPRAAWKRWERST